MKIGAWNYTKCNLYSPKECVDHWKELGFSFMLSSVSKDTKEDNQYILDTLKECEKAGIKLIVVNKCFLNMSLEEVGETSYEEKVREYSKIYNAYSSFGGIFICDEPHAADFPCLKKACSIVSKYAKPFVNFLAINAVVGCCGWDNVNENQYLDMIEDLIKNHGLAFVSYDYYLQCDINFNQKGIDDYFYNLMKFGELARKNNVPFVVTNLSVGHWFYREPTLDDIRWQLSTSLALGATNNLWFFLYEREIESSYRNAPIDLFKRKTEGFYYLKREDYCISLHSNELEGYEFKQALFIKDKNYSNDELGIEIKARNKGNIIVSSFVKFNEIALAIVNNEQKEVEALEINYKGNSNLYYFAPGQMYVIKG